MSDKKFDRTIAILTLIVSVIAAYYAYKSYKLEAEPVLAVRLYQDKRQPNADYDSINIDPKTVNHVDGYMEFELPVKVRNDSLTADANNIIIWLGPTESGDSYKTELVNGDCDWKLEERYGESWYVQHVETMQPWTQRRLPCIKIRIKEGVQEVKLTWDVLASHSPPTSGTLSLHF